MDFVLHSDQKTRTHRFHSRFSVLASRPPSLLSSNAFGVSLYVFVS
jgi:hypothetical protein